MSKQKKLDDKFIKETAKVRCEVCGKEFEQITSFHLKTHDITMHEYREQFPDALLVSEGCRKKFSGENNGMFGKHQTEEHKQKLREAHLGKHHTEAAKQKQSEAHLGKPLTEEHKQHLRKANLGKHLTEEQLQHMRDNQPDRSGERSGMFGKEPWNKGETKETSESVKKNGENISKTKKAFNATEEGQKWLDEHMRDENSPAYIDGTSNLPYCYKFNEELKERVRDFFGRCCYVCGKNEIENGQKLDVHHVNYDKMVCCNDVKPLFVPLCRSCHTKTRKDREYWEEFFSISLKCLTKDQCFLPKEEKIFEK